MKVLICESTCPQDIQLFAQNGYILEFQSTFHERGPEPFETQYKPEMQALPHPDTFDVEDFHDLEKTISDGAEEDGESRNTGAESPNSSRENLFFEAEEHLPSEPSLPPSQNELQHQSTRTSLSSDDSERGYAARKTPLPLGTDILGLVAATEPGRRWKGRWVNGEPVSKVERKGRSVGRFGRERGAWRWIW